MRAIETKYNGYRFRSRVEARWAVFLDHLRVPYEFEKEGYHLPSGSYLPDFWLPTLECWLEIKGTDATPQEQKLCEELSYATDYPVILATGQPARKGGLMVYCVDLGPSGGGFSWWYDCYFALDRLGKVCICSNWEDERTFMKHEWEHWPAMKLTQEARPMAGATIDVAKAARFEHGECGYKTPEQTDEEFLAELEEMKNRQTPKNNLELFKRHPWLLQPLTVKD